MTNIRGALVTMPHKVVTTELVDELTPTAKVAGAANAVLVREDGADRRATSSTAQGFVRGVERKGFELAGKRALVVGNGGVGSPIAASLAAAGRGGDGAVRPERGGVRGRWPSGCTSSTRTLELNIGSKDPEGYDIVVNATPLGMKDDDPLPMDVDRIAPSTFVGEVVMKQDDHAVPGRRAGQGLPDPGRQRHALRDDPGLPGVLRLRHATPEELRGVSKVPS